MDKNLVYLTQTDTTVGFLSFDEAKLSLIKKRDKKQKNLMALDSFKILKTYVNIPKKFRKLIRNSKNTTFIYKNSKSFRVVDKNSNHHRFIKKFSSLYSTSANKTKKDFNINFAFNNCDIAIFSKDDFFQTKPSKIYKLYKNKLLKIR
jgi:tRNA A37 threonylcarbamoyladenosine synthetase subunit TsaC/SUA5/YrdC